MPYAHGLTREDVFAVADAIFAEGVNPTQARVRTRLGTGSFSTISKYLQDWRSQKQEDGLEVDEGQDIPEDHMTLLRRFYGALRASLEVSTISERIDLLERENQELREKQVNYDAIAAELAGMRFAHQQALERLDQLTRENERLTQELAKSKTRKPRATKQAEAT